MPLLLGQALCMLDFGLPTMFALGACCIAASILSLLAATNTPSIYAAIVPSVEKGFQVSPSQISLQWGTFKPFLTSTNANFALGFDDAAGNSYILALMYIIRLSNGSSSNDTDAPLSMEMIWSANQQSPNKSVEDVVLSINEQGNLLLSDASMGRTLWATGTATSGPTTLFLEDSGNLVLSSTNNISSVNASIMWQSFEHPTDTLLQGQNFTANMRLTSSLHTASTIQASVFLKMEEDGIALYADLGQSSYPHMYWKLEADQETAVIDSKNSTIYARMSSMGYLGMYETEEERVSYEVFDTYNLSEVVHRRLKLDADGNLRVYYWANTSWQIDFEAVKKPCSLPYACGPYGICNVNSECMCAALGNVTSGSGDENVSFVRTNESDAKQGCVLKNAESFVDNGCASGKPDKGLFVQLVGMDSLFHENEKASPSVPSNSSSIEECEALCKQDCACTAFFYNKGVANKCFLAYELAEQSMVQTGSINDLAFIKLSSAAAAAASNKSSSSSQQAVPSHGGKQRSLAGQIIAVIAGALVIVLLGVFAVYRYTRGRRAGEVGSSADLEKKAFLSEVPGLPPFVRYKELELGAANFSTQRRAGPLGSLYEGTVAGGAHVAIARLALVNQVDLDNVKLTLAAVGRITHPNVARLRCYSIDGANLALGYELPPNGWLDLAALSWRQRVEVGMGVARALAALHEGGKMVHGLLNLEAVFVAGGGEAKVSGVGVAELVGSGLAEPSPNMDAPPDLADARDVLHFGVVLTELLTGQRVKGDPATWRLRWRDAIGQGHPGELLDRAVMADAMRDSEDRMLRLATSAGVCLHPSPLQRPSISTVVRILDGSLSTLPLV